jgi:hypothetical protein
MRRVTKVNHLRIPLRHLQSFQKRYRNRKAAKKRGATRVRTIANPDAHTVVLLALIALLLLLYLMLRFPGVAAIIAEGNKF